jgi:diaminohydroxyphosphoribosylaminopyrimidine deaminase/5-amino-6-(5-phosphoribosylamino)uracil reductase
VIVRGGRVVAGGRTQAAGRDHAEIDALRKLEMRAQGTTVYVTLEPCNHVGRTGKCTDALIAAGVARVVCGTRDPNPTVKGGGVARLRRAGIDVTIGVLEEDCRASIAPFITWVTTRRPRVTLKAAVTLDGRLAAHGGDSRWVTGEAARREAHRMRDRADAVLVGARTVALDDPLLTTRLPGGHDPQRVILDGRLSVAATARALPGALLVTTMEVGARPELAHNGTEIVQLPGTNGRVDLGALLDALGRRGITSLLVEGGGDVHGQLLAAGLVDEVAIFIAPKLIGAGGVPLVAVEGPARMAEAWGLERVSTRRLGDDILVTGDVAKRRVVRSRRERRH